MASAWDIASSTLLLLLFLGVVYAGLLISRALRTQSTTTRTSLSSRGVTYADGRLSVKTDRAAPSREEYIASTQRAFEQGAKTLSLHPDAFRHGPGAGESAEAPVLGGAVGSSVDTPDKKGFRRTKKLA